MNTWMVMAFGVAIGSLFATLFVASLRRPAPASAGTAVHDAGPVASDPGPLLRVGCYNIHRGKGMDGRKDLGRIAAAIGHADLVGLCEVEGPLYGLAASQPRQLGRALGLGSLFSPTQARWLRYDRGNGLLSRFPISRWYHEPLVDSTGRRGRILTTAEISAGGQPVHLLVTHLSRRLDQHIQLATVLERFVQFDRAILVGDFNVSRSFTVMREFLASGQGTDAIGAALGERDDPTRIDWILTRGLSARGGGWSGLGPSDHPYYWVDLRLSGAVLSQPARARPGAEPRAVGPLPLVARARVKGLAPPPPRAADRTRLRAGCNRRPHPA